MVSLFTWRGGVIFGRMCCNQFAWSRAWCHCLHGEVVSFLGECVVTSLHGVEHGVTVYMES